MSSSLLLSLNISFFTTSNFRACSNSKRKKCPLSLSVLKQVFSRSKELIFKVGLPSLRHLTFPFLLNYSLLTWLELKRKLFIYLYCSQSYIPVSHSTTTVLEQWVYFCLSPFLLSFLPYCCAKRLLFRGLCRPVEFIPVSVADYRLMRITEPIKSGQLI